jgi:tetratricopeptide (TPR) repeat protein
MGGPLPRGGRVRMSSLKPDQPLLHYRIVGKIGEDGMGEVYKAEDSKLSRFVAIKRLPPDTAQDEKAKQRLLREARSASALNHPNIVVIHAIEEADGSNFIVMEYVEGETLKATIGRGPLDLGAQMAEALAAAHAIGWIHRELQDFDQALEWDQQGLEIAREHDLVEAEANSLINLGSDFAHLGEDRKTMPAFRDVDVCFNRDKWMRWQYSLRLQAGACEYWLSQGDPEKAEGHAKRLLDEAASREVRKYIATSYKLLAEVAMARGDAAAAEVSLAAALDQLHSYPAPLVAWRTYVVLGRLRRLMGDGQRARVAFAQAAAIVGEIAANVQDEGLRAIFLNSTAVREVFDGANASSPSAET